ncbi:hypothetical protein IC757_15855 [Wenzhouxiangella sp. AB-CW3]|uniref:hypothetical protein n=1 Tax=Wenzhouxiangella sp. AB-CW3 TaxID=2771012 RepID=UPI00168B394F|nr:hypothetical protein [Wenzhouxiangella sp. AB-CW3]QOC22460.1 hypothetical protein IC757_15855 [Wenzhouxiangella sp. AB-CW3]
MDATFNSAAQALQQGTTNFREAAERVSSGPAQDGFVSAVVEMQSAQREVEAAVEVVRAVDESLGRLIDVMA